ncbi:ABC transporter [Vibrio sp. 10N.286.49.B3]|uniref:ABC transporter permease n=1 Tax=Vibrio sp. 10N.286.49.B3 TaxID=1880855 RepID=UPI000C82CC6F|nr:ABC transporter permease [Vibrio sp. 10N.286.49.B3]PMH44921.1 ABC transporter [Vibrio sp. 10N.286.49.B3]
MTFFALVLREIKSMFTNPVVSLTVFGGVIFYSFLYPLPYSNQTVQELPISVVNLDKSQASFQLERMVDATAQVKVVQRDHTINAAKTSLLNQDVSGILVIPEHFYKDLLLGKSPTLAYAGDASYFLIYGAVVEGLGQAGGTLAAQVKVSQLMMDGTPLSLASQQFTPVELNAKPTFNPRMGYIDYVVPAVFVLILQQTLAMAAGLIGGTQKTESGYWLGISPIKLISARVLALTLVYYLLALYYFGASFEMYGISRLAAMSSLALLLLPFLLSTSFIGILLGAILPRRELVTLVVLISSMPLIFLAGFIWPVESIPAGLVWLSQLFPSTPAIQAFLSMNQMGAELHHISEQYTLMWLQTLLWGFIALHYFIKSHRSQ